jgi:hypothetical protein
MKKIKGKRKRPYLIPITEMIAAYNEYHILTGSPEVKPGNNDGGTGGTSIENPTEDNTDTELTGGPDGNPAKGAIMWDHLDNTWKD